MKTFAFRLFLMLALLYGLGALAYGLLHYPAGERPGVGTILSDFNADVGALFRPKVSPEPGPEAGTPVRATEDPTTALDRLRGDVGRDLDLSMDLGRIVVPGTTAHLQARAAETWGALLPIHAKTLPEGIDELGRLRSLRGTDKAAFERERESARARLVPARKTLLEHTQGKDPLEAAVRMLDVLDRLDARLAAL